VHDAGVTRRQALALLAGAAASVALVGCDTHTSPTTRSPSTRARTPSPSGTARLATNTDWRAFARSLDGTVLRPGEAGYDRARLLFDRRFDSVMPEAIAQVASEADVASCVAFARRFGIPLRLRSGGHSYIGASIGTGMVIDLRQLSRIDVSSNGQTATIGAGAALVDVYNTLAGHGVAIPAGSCPTVGLSGLTLGGGVGVVSRRYGLTCDRLGAARLITAEGQTLTCSATSHPDLYWALRGGGGSFGVVTEMTLATHPTEPLSHAFVSWPWSAAADVVRAWQTWAPAAPESLWSTAHVLATGTPGPPAVSVAAVMVAGAPDLQEQIGRLVQSVPVAATATSVATDGYQETMMLEAGCADLTVRACHVAAETPGGTLPRDAFVAASDFFTEPIPAAGIDALVASVAARQSDPRLGTGGASFDILGGAVDAVAADQSAWVHRGALFNAQYTASWGSMPGNGPLARNRRSLADIHDTVRRYGTGQAYQNYADATLPDPQQAYYGANLARLVEIRRQFDPAGVFTQPQGVPLRPVS
jgi:FAD/FMN-containing dehydrogenase